MSPWRCPLEYSIADQSSLPSQVALQACGTMYPTDHIVPRTHILTSVDNVPERENILKKDGVPEEDSNMRECNDVREAIAGPSSMNIHLSPLRHIPTTGYTALMINYN